MSGRVVVRLCSDEIDKRSDVGRYFEDEKIVQEKRAAAAACHPLLPGPISPKEVKLPIGESPAKNSGNCGIVDQFHDCKLPEITRTADILVVAVGHPNLVRRHWVKPGAVVLDVGINVIPSDGANEAGSLSDLHLAGDVAFEEVSKIARAISPVPGGVGPMTISSLMHNTLLAAKHRVADDW